MPNITHELQPGEMHCNMRNMKDQLTFLPSRHVQPLTERKLHPEIFSHGVLHADHRCHFPRSMMTRKGMETYLGRISIPAVGPGDLIPKSRHLNAPAHWKRSPVGMPCTRYTYNLPWGNANSAPHRTPPCRSN